MSQCPRCGALLVQGSSTCPSCSFAVSVQEASTGKVASGPPPLPPPLPQPTPPGGNGGKFALWGVLIAVGCLVFVAILGIIAAIFIPNFVDALAKAKAKRTMADLRNVSTALASYVTDKGVYPDADSMDGLAAALAPDYLATVPQLDGWQHPFRYQCLERGTSDLSGAEIAGCTSFGLASAGRDGQFENEDLRDYEETVTEREAYDRDIVVIDMTFVQQPARR